MIGDTTQDPWGFPPQSGPDPRDPTTPGTPNSNPWTPEDLASARSYYTDWMSARPTINQYGTLDDVIGAYQLARRGGQAHDPALQAGINTLGWQSAPLAPAPSAGPSTAGTPGPQGGAPAPNVGGLIQPFGGTFAPPAASPYPDAPKFTPPSMADAANDPGYEFSLNQGKKNLESWLSAHGTFNDSSAVEALQNYGQGAASTQYGNVWNRNYQAYQGALGPWQTDVGRIQHDNDQGWQNAFNTWLQNWNQFKDQRDSTFDKQFRTATA